MYSQLKYHDTGIDRLNNNSHIHGKEFEILHVINGNGTIIIKDKIYELKPNTIFFINGSEAHYTSPSVPNNYVRNKIIFPCEKLLKVSDIFSLKNCIDDMFFNCCVINLTAETSLKIDELFFEMANYNNPDTSKIKFLINIFSILNFSLNNKKENIKNINNKIALVINFINENLQNKLTLNQICENTNVSKYYLCHKFKTTVGMTVFDYIEFARISLAKDLLTKTDNSISLISQKVGFESFAYFSKVFKSYENCTPSAFRKQNIVI